MEATEFLGMEPTPDPLRWRLPVLPPICSGTGALFGGCALAAAVEAMEQATGRPLIWATAQFLSYSRPPAVLDVETTVLVTGNHVTQARALLHGDGQQVAAVIAALGGREQIPEGSWAVRPEVELPAALPVPEAPPHHRQTMHDRVDVRLATVRSLEQLDGTPGDGRSSLWVRVRDLAPSAAALAIVGDYVPMGVSQALGVPMRSTSLDNTLRVVDPGAAGWMLCDVRIHAIAGGHAHGLNHIWSEDGRLLATAAQSIAVRARRPSAAQTPKP